MTAPEQPPLISVPCTVRLMPHKWPECWSCAQPAEYLPPQGPTAIEHGSAYITHGTPIRHLPGCIQVEDAKPGRPQEIVERYPRGESMEVDLAPLPDQPDRR